MSRKHLATLLIATGLVAGAAAPAQAHKLTATEARAAATVAAKRIARETGSSGSRVTTCRLRGSHRADCQAASRYRTGASPCVTDVRVTFVSPRGRRTRARLGQTLCY